MLNPCLIRANGTTGKGVFLTWKIKDLQSYMLNIGGFHCSEVLIMMICLHLALYARGGSGTAGVDLISDICISMKAVDFLKMSEKISNRIEVAMNKKEHELYMGVDHSVRHLGY